MNELRTTAGVIGIGILFVASLYAAISITFPVYCDWVGGC